MEMIRIHKLTKADFNLGEEAFDEDGLVVEGAEFTIKKLRIGTFTQYDVKAICVREQTTPIILGKEVLEMFTFYTLDKTKKKFVFE